MANRLREDCGKWKKRVRLEVEEKSLLVQKCIRERETFGIECKKFEQRLQHANALAKQAKDDIDAKASAFREKLLERDGHIDRLRKIVREQEDSLRKLEKDQAIQFPGVVNEALQTIGKIQRNIESAQV